ncbi:MAG: 4Fe-4S ferredoxin [Desulfobacterales bacterium]|nr:4Fe-4S ferredoxin [Desulfobacterales bacterium]MCP4163256.1 4Fe-4S ferredoxin [Deltaproteobacteria bacterium]
MEAAYKKLAEHLDNLPAGFPPTESGIELKVLKHIFSPEEAETAVGLTMMPEKSEAIAERMGVDIEGFEEKLFDMSKKGQIFRYSRDGEHMYMAAMFVVGIWEYQLNRLNKDLIRDFNEYSASFMKQAWQSSETKQLRVIPIEQSIPAEMNIMTYDKARELIMQQSKIVLSDCICRKEHNMMDEGCDHPLDVCLAFGGGAYYYESNGLGKAISQEEAIKVLERGMDAGLVLQPGNSLKPFNICMCCGCSCQILKNLKDLGNPGEIVVTNFYAEVEMEECTGCSQCEDRCHMDAIVMEDDIAEVQTERCIGCGVCVPSCEFDALSMKKKPDDLIHSPPKNTVETYMKIAQERGLI